MTVPKAKTTTNTNGQTPKDPIQDIIDGLPQTDDEALLVAHLIQDVIITQASKLKPSELLLLEVQLKQQPPYKAQFIRSWISQVKARQKLAQKAAIPDVPSHIDIAQMYIKVMGRITMYARSDWHRYKDGVWTVLPEIFFEQEIYNLLAGLEKQYDVSFTKYDLRSVSAFIAADLAVRDELLDADDGLVNMKNGVFSIKQQKLLPHDPKYYQTTQLPFDYDAKAKYPKWNKYLKTTLVKWNEQNKKWETDQDLIDFTQEITGYSLTSSVALQIMFWLIGKGANGKGVFTHILQSLAGSAAMPLDIGGIRQNNTYQLAMMAGKKIAYSTEAERNADMVSDGIIKSLVSGDPVMVRQIREKPFELHSIAKLWWSMNKLPKVNDTSHGFWRRVRVIPFNRIFEGDEINESLKEELEAELPGIFNWAMEGWKRVLSNGKLTEPAQVGEMTKQYRKESNPAEMFVEEECNTDPDFNTMTITPLYQAYKDWCHEGNYRPLSRKNFKNELADLGYPEDRKTAGTVIVGLELKPKPAPNLTPFTVTP